MRRTPFVTAITAAGLLALGGVAYAGGTGEPRTEPRTEDRCATAQSENLVAIGGVCPDTLTDSDTLLDPDTLIGLR